MKKLIALLLLSIATSFGQVKPIRDAQLSGRVTFLPGTTMNGTGLTLINFPGGGSNLPDPTGHPLQFLQTDGVSFLWSTVPFSQLSGTPTTLAGYGIVIANNTLTESMTINLTSDLASKALDSAVVHNTTNESIAGTKTFSSVPVLPAQNPGNFFGVPLSSLGAQVPTFNPLFPSTSTNVFGTTSGRGINHIWIAAKPQVAPTAGSGTEEDPFDGGTRAKFDAIIASYASTPNLTIHLGAGTFQTQVYPAAAYSIQSGWSIIGEGMYATTIQAYADPSGFTSSAFMSVINDNGGAHDGRIFANFTADANWTNIAPLAVAGSGGGTISPNCSTINGNIGVVCGSDASGSTPTAGYGSAFGFGFVDVTRTISGSGIQGSSSISGIPSTTISASSDGVTLPQNTINVTSTLQFYGDGSHGGTFYIIDGSDNRQVITYTGRTSGAFTGCSGGTGVIHSGNVVTTVSQFYLNQAANATGTASLTIGGEKNMKISGIGISGSHNTIFNVRSINEYGSKANSAESFGFAIQCVGEPGCGGNLISHCINELPKGNYQNPIGLFGPFMVNESPHKNSAVIGNRVFGINNGLGGGFTTGGVNLANVQHILIDDNIFVDCQGAAYQDTDNIDDVTVSNNMIVRSQLGIGLGLNASGAINRRIRVINNRIGVLNRFPGGGSYGIIVGPASGGPSDKNEITGNTITYDSSGFGLNQYGSILAQNTTNTKCVNNILDPGATFARVAGAKVQFGNRHPDGSMITEDQGIPDLGITDGSVAPAGAIGEDKHSYISSTSPSVINYSNGVTANVTSLSLTPGSWQVWGSATFGATSATITQETGGVTVTSATMPNDGTETYSGLQTTTTTETNSVTIPMHTVNISSNTTLYLVGKVAFSAGTVSGFGTLSALRIR